MSRNEIGLDQIQRRLGSAGKSRSSYDDDGFAPVGQDFDHGGDDQGTSLNAGFMASVVAVFLAVGGGTFFFIDGGISMPKLNLFGGLGGSDVAALSGSKLDGTCGKGWQAGQPNVDQMHCYLTREPYRLCDEAEHEALLATIRQYDQDYKVWHRQFMMATFKTIGKTQTQGLQLGLEAAKLDNMSGSDKEKSERMDKVAGIASDIMKPTSDVLAQRVNKVPQYELANAAFALAKKGYIVADDFGRSKPDFITNALQKAGKVKNACPNRG